MLNVLFYRRVCFRAAPLFDAIVADPPYGIRAGTFKRGQPVPAGAGSDSAAENASAGAGALFRAFFVSRVCTLCSASFVQRGTVRGGRFGAHVYYSSVS